MSYCHAWEKQWSNREGSTLSHVNKVGMILCAQIVRFLVLTLHAFYAGRVHSGKSKVTAWRPSVWGSMWRGQHTFRPDTKEDRHALVCYSRFPAPQTEACASTSVWPNAGTSPPEIHCTNRYMIQWPLMSGLLCWAWYLWRGEAWTDEQS